MITYNTSFEELIKHCCDPSSKQWQTAWREFIRRYKHYMYKLVTTRCLRYNLPSIKKALSEVVNDIINEIIIQLCKEECRSLKQCRGQKNEKMFLGWLAIVSIRLTDRYIKKHYLNPTIEEDIENLKNILPIFDPEILSQLYEEFVGILRASQKSVKPNLERDIHIFKLYTWADFSEKMITSLPCLNTIGHRVVDNVINRMRGYLRSQK